MAVVCATTTETKEDLKTDESLYVRYGYPYAYSRFYPSTVRYVGAPSYYRYASPYTYAYEPYARYYDGLDRVVLLKK